MLEGQTTPATDERPKIPIPRGARRRDFTQDMLEFCRALREKKVKVTTGRILDLYNSLQIIDVTQKDDFRTASRSNLVSNYDELKIFDELFDEYWAIEDGDVLPEGADGCGPEGEPPPMDPESCGPEGEDPGQEGEQEGDEQEGEGQGEGEEEEQFMLDDEDGQEGEEGDPSGNASRRLFPAPP